MLWWMATQVFLPLFSELVHFLNLEFWQSSMQFGYKCVSGNSILPLYSLIFLFLAVSSVEQKLFFWFLWISTYFLQIVPLRSSVQVYCLSSGMKVFLLCSLSKIVVRIKYLNLISLYGCFISFKVQIKVILSPLSHFPSFFVLTYGWPLFNFFCVWTKPSSFPFCLHHLFKNNSGSPQSPRSILLLVWLLFRQNYTDFITEIS